MARQYKEISPGKYAVRDILCDRCGHSCKTISGYEKATMTAAFEEGFHAGDRFALEFCADCFDDIMGNVLVDNMGTCTYHSEILGDEITLDDLREMYAHLCSGTLIFDEDDVPDFDDEDDN